MGTLLRVVLVAAHVAATASSCPAPVASAPAPELARAYSANVLHAHGQEPEGRAGELRAPCACGCDERPVATLGSGVLGAALLPAASIADLPRAAHFTAVEAGARLASARVPDPVPRLA
jgi:hypothetical protein